MASANECVRRKTRTRVDSSFDNCLSIDALLNNEESVEPYVQRNSQETRLCGKERLKEDFLFDCSVDKGGVLVAVVVVVVDDDEDGDDAVVVVDLGIALGSVVLVADEGRGDGGAGESDSGAGVIGDGREGIEKGVVGEEILKAPG